MLGFGKREESTPQPQRTPRKVALRVFTSSGWLRGELQLPGIVRLLDFIDNETYLRLTQAHFEHDPPPVEFFALRRDAIRIALIQAREMLELPETIGYQEHHEVVCRIADGVLRGFMPIRLGGRLSDYLERQQGFIVLTDAQYRIRDPFTAEVDIGEAAVILVNPDAIIGVTEPPRR